MVFEISGSVVSLDTRGQYCADGWTKIHCKLINRNLKVHSSQVELSLN